jgi:hypothetical protein
MARRSETLHMCLLPFLGDEQISAVKLSQPSLWRLSVGPRSQSGIPMPAPVVSGRQSPASINVRCKNSSNQQLIPRPSSNQRPTLCTLEAASRKLATASCLLTGLPRKLPARIAGYLCLPCKKKSENFLTNDPTIRCLKVRPLAPARDRRTPR